MWQVMWQRQENRLGQGGKKTNLFNQTKKQAVPAPTSELLCKVKLLGARCTILHAISYISKKLTNHF